MKSRIQLTSLLLVITGAAIFLSCDDDDDNETPPDPRKELLTAGPWKRTALVSNPAYDWNANGVSATDILNNTMFPCEKDNFDEYKANGIFESNEGPTKCNSQDPQTWTETWELIDNKIFYVGADYSYHYTLVEVTETTLKLRATFHEDGVSYTHEEAYSH